MPENPYQPPKEGDFLREWQTTFDAIASAREQPELIGLKSPCCKSAVIISYSKKWRPSFSVRCAGCLKGGFSADGLAETPIWMQDAPESGGFQT